MAPGRRIHRALVGAVDVAIRRAAAPGLPRGRQLDEQAPFRATHDAQLASEHEHRVSALEQLRVRLDERAIAHVHALLVTLGHDDQVHGQLAGDRLDGHQGVPLRHLRSLGVDRAASDQHLLVRRLLDDVTREGWPDPKIGLCDRHGVVHPVDHQGLLGALVALGVHDGIALLAPLRDTRVVNLGALATQLVEVPFDHLGGFLDALPGVGDARLLDPLLQVAHVLIDVSIDVVEDLRQVRVLDLTHVDRDLGVALRTDAGGRRAGAGCGHLPSRRHRLGGDRGGNRQEGRAAGKQQRGTDDATVRFQVMAFHCVESCRSASELDLRAQRDLTAQIVVQIGGGLRVCRGILRAVVGVG